MTILNIAIRSSQSFYAVQQFEPSETWGQLHGIMMARLDTCLLPAQTSESRSTGYDQEPT